MTKDDQPEEVTTDFKQSKHLSNRRKESKKKKAKKKEKGKKERENSNAPINSDCHHESSREDDVLPSNNNIVAAQVDSSAKLGGRNKKMASNADEKLNNSSSNEGWSWGAAFAAASKIQPTDLGEQFLNSATTTTTTALDAGDEEADIGVAHVSHLVQEYTSTRKKYQPKDDNMPVKVNNDDTAAAAATKRKPKRKIMETRSNRSDVDEDNDNEDEDDIAERDPSAGESLQLPLKELGSSKKSVPDFPYPTNPDDHCETPLQSYLDILPILNKLTKHFGGKKCSMRIYDPYYCDGSVVRHLSSLGFTNVYNRKEDCYEAWEKLNSPPQYDLLMTNPPYSEDHIEKLMNYVTAPSFGSKPWLLLMPQWVHKKDYYLNAISRYRACDDTRATKNSPANPFYIVPRKRYVYLPPANFREKKDSDVHKKSSLFVSMWYCWGGDTNANEELMNEFRNSSSSVECDLARSKNALRDLRRSGDGSGRDSKKLKTGK